MGCCAEVLEENNRQTRELNQQGFRIKEETKTFPINKKEFTVMIPTLQGGMKRVLLPRNGRKTMTIGVCTAKCKNTRIPERNKNEYVRVRIFLAQGIELFGVVALLK